MRDVITTVKCCFLTMLNFYSVIRNLLNLGYPCISVIGGVQFYETELHRLHTTICSFSDEFIRKYMGITISRSGNQKTCYIGLIPV
jgi:hypothetical protein